MRLNPPAIDLPLQSRLTARALLNRFMLAALFCCAGSLWASAQDFSATATNVAPSNIYDGQRRQVLRVAITNLAGGTSADLRLKTLGLRFENAAGNPLNTADAGNLFESVEVYRDTDSSGTFNAINDGVLTGLYYPELDANGSLSVDLQ